jgi:hypothetical protein
MWCGAKAPEVNADNVRVNAKVDYTLLDRWRASNAWTTRRRLHEAAPAARRDVEGNNVDPLGDESEHRSGRVVHMPLAD